MAESLECIETFYSLCAKLTENFEKMRNSRDYYRMDAIIKRSNSIGDFVEEIRLLSHVPLVYDDIMEDQSILSVSDEESTTADFPEEDDMPARMPDADEDWDEEVQELKKMLAERKRDRDNYYRRTILVRNLLRSNDGDQNLSYYSKIFKNLKECSLERLMLECEKFFVLENGNVRFTYSTRREAICWLIEARSTAQQLKYRWTQLGRPNIQIEMMVPPDSVGLKYKIQNYGRRLKLQRVVQSYQAVETRESGEWKIQLRLYLRGYGTFTIKSGDLGDNFDEVLEKARTMINSLQGMGVDRLFQTEE